MITVDKIFGNLFITPLITPDRLLLYAKDHLARLIKGNGTGKFTAAIAFLTPLVAALEADVSNVDSTLNLQSGQTDEVDLVTSQFSHTMSTLEGVIANSLGGISSIGYKEFYPHMLKDYGAANRKTMPTLTTRVFKAATKYATALGATVTAQLQAFQAGYLAARDAQSTSIADLSSDRTDRTGSLANMQVALVQSLHLVGSIFPADVVKCSGFFNFNLLFTVGHRKHVLYNGLANIAKTEVIVNRSFSDSVSIIFRNKSTNADYIVWIGATATDAPNAQAITVKASQSVVVVPSTIGDLANTFLLILDASAVNAAVYQVETIG